MISQTMLGFGRSKSCIRELAAYGARRKAEIEEINAVYAPGGDHEELLNSLRKDYYDYLAKDGN